MTDHATQGHRYACDHTEVIALESGERCVQVSVINHDLMYPLEKPIWVHVSQLKPLPMRYFGGATHG